MTIRVERVEDRLADFTDPDEILYEAIGKMVRNDIGRLPVVSRDNSSKALGYLGRAAVMTARLHRMNEEHEREPGN